MYEVFRRYRPKIDDCFCDFEIRQNSNLNNTRKINNKNKHKNVL